MKYRKMILMNLLQGRNGDADVKNGLVDTVEAGREWDRWRK